VVVDEHAETVEQGDEPEPGELDEGEREPEREPDENGDTAAVAPPALDDREIEKRLTALGKEATRHSNRVSEIMGEDAQVLTVCPLCPPVTPGFVFPGDVEPDVRDRVLELLGMGAPHDYATDPEAETCDVCHGLGQLVTGSRVQGQETRPCAKCTAKGWTNESERQMWQTRTAMPPATPPVQNAAGATVTVEQPIPGSDMYGRPVGHPNYGKMPVYMTAAEREADEYVT